MLYCDDCMLAVTGGIDIDSVLLISILCCHVCMLAVTGDVDIDVISCDVCMLLILHAHTQAPVLPSPSFVRCGSRGGLERVAEQACSRVVLCSPSGVDRCSSGFDLPAQCALLLCCAVLCCAPQALVVAVLCAGRVSTTAICTADTSIG